MNNPRATSGSRQDARASPQQTSRAARVLGGILSLLDSNQKHAAANCLGLEKVRDVAVRRLAYQIFRRFDLLKGPVAHDSDAIRQRDAVGQIMRNVDGRQAMLAVKFHNLTPHLKPVRRIYVAQRFVHKKNARSRSHGAAQGDRCCWPPESWRVCAGTKTRRCRCAAPTAEKVTDPFLRPFPDLERQGEVAVAALIKDFHVRPEGIILKNHLDAALADGHVIDGHTTDVDGPSSGVSSPAISLSVVVLPQPLSPTMTRNSPSLTARLACLTATTEPNFFVRLRRRRKHDWMLLEAARKDNMTAGRNYWSKNWNLDMIGLA